MHHDPRNFSPAPDTFLPERSLIASGDASAAKQLPFFLAHSSTFVRNEEAFIPFSYGPANCAGRNLALVEMRMVVALLMQRFEMRFAPGYDPKRWEEEIEDFFVVKNGKLPVVLTPRM